MMGRMSTDNPVQPPAPAEAVIEFGGGSEERAPAARGRRSLTELAQGLAADRRSVPLAAVVGAVALFASLLSEWQVTMVDAAQFQDVRSDRPLPAGVADLGALGSGYIAGLFVLAGAMVLVLFGPHAGRRHARLLGMTAAGVLLGLLAATASELGGSSRAAALLFVVGLEEDQIHLTYGRGIVCAVAGVLDVLLALWLAGRHLPPDGPAVPGSEQAAEPEPEAGPVVWSWRRPVREELEEEDERPDAPIDLTVSSSTPFTLRDEDRDKPANGGEKPG
jgi:hypothetical protein